MYVIAAESINDMVRLVMCCNTRTGGDCGQERCCFPGTYSLYTLHCGTFNAWMFYEVMTCYMYHLYRTCRTPP